jgi:hypothetical protein
MRAISYTKRLATQVLTFTVMPRKYLARLDYSILPVSDLFLVIPQDLPRSFVFPVSPLLDRPVKGNGLIGAIVDAAAAVPAFIRVQDNRGFSFFRVGDKDINLADLHAGVASGTEIGVVNYGISGADDIW